LRKSDFGLRQSLLGLRCLGFNPRNSFLIFEKYRAGG
jgi:hypothetical protein